jgi:hypothetical protein
MIQGILLNILLLCLPAWAHAVTYYLDDAGSNANPGTADKPWLEWKYAFDHSNCGDILIVMDGTYTQRKHGSFSLTKGCTAGAVYTVRAQNERRASIDSDGTSTGLRIASSAFVTVEGLRVKSLDNASGIATSNVIVKASNNVTLKRLLVSHNNRYFNSHLIELNHSTRVLLEENELYFFHRHGILMYYTNDSVVRRNYGNARNSQGIPGGFNGTSGDNGSGDDFIVIYPGDNNIIENNIADGSMAKGYTVESVSISTNNRFYGNISNGPDRGITFDARGNSAALMPNDSYIENFVSINPSVATFGKGGREGVYSRSARNIQCKQCTVIGSPSRGYVADKHSSKSQGDGVYSFFVENSLVSNSTNIGFQITADVQTWNGAAVSSYNAPTNFSPAVSNHWVNKMTVDPGLGTCKVWIPDGSPMKGAGTGGKDIGANILYRYENGALTKVPLWDRATGEFPQGARVAGLNDVPNESLFDVHKRLNVNSNGCSFPANYGGGTSDTSAPSVPAGLRAS